MTPNGNTGMWSYRSDLTNHDRDLIGYDVEAVDGSIGKIDETSNDADHSHLVVDTGFWIFGKKRLIPAGVVSRVDATEQKVYVDITKEQIKSAPDFDPDRASQRDDYDTYYGSFR